MKLIMIDAKLKGYSLAEISVKDELVSKIIPTNFDPAIHWSAKNDDLPEYIAAFNSKSQKEIVKIRAITFDMAMHFIDRRKILSYPINSHYFLEHRKTMNYDDIILEEIKNTIIHNGMNGAKLIWTNRDGRNAISVLYGSAICHWRGDAIPERVIPVTIRAALQIVEENRHLDMQPGLLHVHST